MGLETGHRCPVAGINLPEEVPIMAMTVNEAASLLGVNDKRIYTLIRYGKLKAEKLPVTLENGLTIQRWTVTASEDELRESHASLKVRPRGRPLGSRTESNGNGASNRYLSMQQIGKLLGCSPEAARQRIAKRGLNDKCIKVGAAAAFPERLLGKIRETRSTIAKARETSSRAAVIGTGPTLGSTFQSSLKALNEKVDKLLEKVDKLLVIWGS